MTRKRERSKDIDGWDSFIGGVVVPNKDYALESDGQEDNEDEAGFNLISGMDDILDHR